MKKLSGSIRGWRKLLPVRMSVRAMMLLVLVLATELGRRVHLARQQREAVAAVRKVGGTVYFDWQFGNDQYFGGSARAPAWLRRTIGDEYFQEVAHVGLMFLDAPYGMGRGTRRGDLDAAVDKLAAFSSLKSIGIQGQVANDKTLATITRLGELEVLRIYDGSISGPAMAELTHMKRLRVLDLNDVGVTSAGLAKLRAALPSLKVSTQFSEVRPNRKGRSTMRSYQPAR